MKDIINATFKVAGVFFIYKGMVFLPPFFMAPAGNGAAPTFLIVNALIAFAFAIVLIFFTKPVIQLLGISKAGSAAPLNVSSEALLQIGIIVAGLIGFTSSLDRLIFTLPMMSKMISAMPLKVLTDFLPAAFSLFLILGSNICIKGLKKIGLAS